MPGSTAGGTPAATLLSYVLESRRRERRAPLATTSGFSARTRRWDFFLSQLTLTAMLLADVTTQIPTCPFRADVVRGGICRLCWMPVLLVACHCAVALRAAAPPCISAGQ